MFCCVEQPRLTAEVIRSPGDQGERDAEGNGPWTWHSLRHVFCTTAGILDRARTATSQKTVFPAQRRQ